MTAQPPDNPSPVGISKQLKLNLNFIFVAFFRHITHVLGKLLLPEPSLPQPMQPDHFDFCDKAVHNVSPAST